MRHEQVETFIDLFTKCRLGIIKFTRHVDVMIAQAWEHKRDGPIPALLKTCQHLRRAGRFERRDGILAALTDQRTAEGESTTPDLQGEGEIGQGLLRMLA